MDSIMLGSLTFYRRFLLENVFSRSDMSLLQSPSIVEGAEDGRGRLPILGHALAGVMAGATVSFVAAPVEHIKARLQIQYAADKSKRLYSGPVDCFSKIVSLLSVTVPPCKLI